MTTTMYLYVCFILGTISSNYMIDYPYPTHGNRSVCSEKQKIDTKMLIRSPISTFHHVTIEFESETPAHWE